MHKIWGKNQRIARKGVALCRSKDPIVIKTIRAHKDNVQSWVGDTDIKVSSSRGTKLGPKL